MKDLRLRTVCLPVQRYYAAGSLSLSSLRVGNPAPSRREPRLGRSPFKIEVRSFLPVQSGCEMPHPRASNFIFNCRGGYYPPARRRDLRAEKGSTILAQKIIKEKPRSFLRGFFRKVTNSTTRLYHILPSMSIEFQKNILFIHSFVNKYHERFIFMVLKALFTS